MGACYCTTDRLSSPALPRSSSFVTVLCAEAHQNSYSLRDLLCTRETWMTLAHQKKLNSSLPMKGGQYVIRKQMAGISISSTALRKKCLFKWQGFCPLIILEPTIQNISCSNRKNATNINDDNEKIAYKAIQETDHRAPQVVTDAVIMLFHLLLATPDCRTVGNCQFN